MLNLIQHLKNNDGIPHQARNDKKAKNDKKHSPNVQYYNPYLLLQSL